MQLRAWSADERVVYIVAVARGRRSAFTGDATQCLSDEWIDVGGAGEACVVDNPETAVLAPGEVAQKVVFGVDVVPERAGAKEDVDIAAIGELAKDLEKTCLAKMMVIGVVWNVWDSGREEVKCAMYGFDVMGLNKILVQCRLSMSV